MRKFKVLRRVIAAATLLAVSWWFVLDNGDGVIQAGPFSSGPACVKVAQTLIQALSATAGNNVCYSSGGGTLPIFS